MPADTLHVLPGGKFFMFRTVNMNASKIHRVQRDGNAYTIPMQYPSILTSLRDFKKVFPQGKADAEALKYIKDIKEIPNKLETLSTVNNLDYKFARPPYLHQLMSLEYMFHYPRLALVLDMGLGKTFISVNYLSITKQKAVVFGPPIVLDTWFNQIKEYTTLKPVIYQGTKGQKAKLRDSITAGQNADWDVIITNYEAVVPRKGNEEDFHFFRGLNHTCTIIDEASRLLGHDAQRCTAVNIIANTESVTNVYLLSGTLSKGKPTDIFMPFKIMDHEVLGGNYWHFRKTYCTFSAWNKNIIVGYKNLDELKACIDPYMLCLKRADCLDLPDRDFVQVEYKMTDEQRLVYEAVRDEDVVRLPLQGKVQPIKVMYNPDLHGEVRCKLAIVKLNKLQQILSGFITLSPDRDLRLCNECPNILECMMAEFEIFPWSPNCVRFDPTHPVPKPESKVLYFNNNPKMDALENILLELGVAEHSTKCIIWAYYRKDLKLIQEKLTAKGIKYITPDDANCEKRYRESPDVPVFVGQVNKGIGLTLNSAKVMVYYSYSLELEHRSQSLDRNYRIGQDDKVLVEDLVHPRSVESGILNMLDKKEDVKEFMQKNNACKTCDQAIKCLEIGRRAYTEGCKFYSIRQNAEKKETIKIV